VDRLERERAVRKAAQRREDARRRVKEKAEWRKFEEERAARGPVTDEDRREMEAERERMWAVFRRDSRRAAADRKRKRAAAEERADRAEARRAARRALRGPVAAYMEGRLPRGMPAAAARLQAERKRTRAEAARARGA
jgi:hypothetical protein